MQNQRRAGLRQMPPTVPQGQVVADFSLYPEAVAFVERMIANNFPATAIAIVGSDLRSVERVRGQLSFGRVAINGLYNGSFFGLAFGFVFGNQLAAEASAVGQVGSPVLACALMGAGLGMLVNVTRLALTKNRRGFVSASMVIASKYQVQVPEYLAAQAIEAGNKTPIPNV